MAWASTVKSKLGEKLYYHQKYLLLLIDIKDKFICTRLLFKLAHSIFHDLFVSKPTNKYES